MAIFQTGIGETSGVVFSADSSKAYVATGTSVDVYSTATGLLLTRYTTGTGAAIKGVALDITPDGSTLVIAAGAGTLTAFSGNTAQTTAGFYTLNLNSGVATYHETTLINGGGFYDIAALTNNKVILSYNVGVDTGTVPLVVYDLGTGVFTQQNTPSGVGQTFNNTPQFAFVGGLTVSADHSGILARQETPYTHVLATYDPAGAATATATISQGDSFYSLQAISVTANKVVEAATGALNLYDSQLHFIKDIAPTINAQMIAGSLTSITFNEAGTLLYGLNPTTGLLYAFDATTWQIANSWAIGAYTKSSYIFANEMVVSGNDHYLTITGRLLDLTQDNSVEGTSGNDVLTATGVQVLYGLDGNDTLSRSGTDVATLIGGAGDDSYIVNDTLSIILETANGGNDTMRTTVSITAAANIENLVLAPGAVATITAAATGTRLVGNELGTALIGNAGVDTFIGGLGNDILTGGSEDTAVFNATLAGTTIDITSYVNRGGFPYRATQQVIVHSADGNDTVNTIGKLQFNDGAIYTINTYVIDQNVLTLLGRHATTAELAMISATMPTLLSDGDVRMGVIAALHLNRGQDDFNGDGRSDILWRNADGTISSWLATAAGGFVVNDANARVNVSNAWHIVDTGDFNGDGRSDILWRSDSGALSNWLGTASGGFTPNDGNAMTQVPTSWHVSHVGDFNGDGRSDILWRNDAGQISNWLGTASGGFANNDGNAFQNVPLNWHIADVGDFNGDGRADILWRSDAGQISDWLGTASGGFLNNDGNAFNQAPLDWHVIGAGDFNGDGRADILWRNDNGRLSDWLGTASGGFVNNDANALNQVPTDWQVVDVGDYNGDGRADILWRNADGALSNWLGTSTGGFVSNDANAFTHVDNSWHVQDYQFI